METVPEAGEVVVIEDWVLCSDDWAESRVGPEEGHPRIHGHVWGHEGFNDGDLVTSSTIRGRIRDLLLTASGRIYQLGYPETVYSAHYPNAFDRLIQAMPCVALLDECKECPWPCKRQVGDWHPAIGPEPVAYPSTETIPVTRVKVL